MLCFLVKNLEQQKIPLNLEFFLSRIEQQKMEWFKSLFSFSFPKVSQEPNRGIWNWMHRCSLISVHYELWNSQEREKELSKE